MPEKVDYREFQYIRPNDKKKNKAISVTNAGYPDKISQILPEPKRKSPKTGRRREFIVVLAIILCFCTTLLCADYFSNGYLLADFDKNATVSAEGAKYYAVQTGIYTDRKTAELYAKSLRSRGGAGYVMYDGVYRVVASVYTKALQAQTIAERMGKAGTDATVFSFSLSSVSDSSLSQEDRNKLISLSGYTDYCYEELYNLSNAIDAGAMTENELKARLSNLESYLLSQKEIADGIEFSTTALSLSSAINSSVKIIKDVPSTPSSGDIRYAYTAILALRI